jgi:hypothetical protein
MMFRVNKAQVLASAKELECIRVMAGESPDGPHVVLRFHAASAQRHIAILAQAGAAIPSHIVKSWPYFKSIGWIPLHVTRPDPDLLPHERDARSDPAIIQEGKAKFPY